MLNLTPEGLCDYVEEIGSYFEDTQVEVSDYRAIMKNGSGTVSAGAEDPEDALGRLEHQLGIAETLESKEYWMELNINSSFDLNYSAVIINPENGKLQAAAASRKEPEKARIWEKNMNRALEDRGFNLQTREKTEQEKLDDFMPEDQEKTTSEVSVEEQKAPSGPKAENDPRHKYTTD